MEREDPSAGDPVTGQLRAPAPSPHLKTYALPRFGFSLVLTVVDFVVLFLYTDLYQIPGILAGIAAGLGKLSIALSSFVGGFLSDRTKTRWGKRRPYLLVGSPLLMLVFVCLLVPTFVLGYDAPTLTVFAWYLAFNCLFQALYGILWSTYHSLMPAFTRVDERPGTSMWQNLFNYLATGIGVAYTFVGVSHFTDKYEETGVLDPGFAWVFVAFGSVIVILLYFMHFRIPLASGEFEESHDNFVENFKVIARNKNYLWITAFHGVTGLASGMQTSLLYGYAENVLKLQGMELYVFAVMLIVGILLFVGMWRKLIETRGKKKVLRYVLGFQIAFMPLTLVGLVQSGSMFAFGIVFVLGITCSMSGWALFPYIMYADVAEDHRRAEGDDRAGLYQGFAVVPLNIFQALSLFVAGALLSLPNVAGADFSWGYVLWGPLGACYLLVALVILSKRVKLDYEWEK
ncbi:MAG: MFS transporter [Promethearchaeota archaeon]